MPHWMQAARFPPPGIPTMASRYWEASSQGSATWYLPWVDYVITGYPTIAASGSLTINDGCTIRFNSARYLTINGTLNATGTSGNGILFTRNGSAEWGGLKYQNGSNGTLEYCTIEYATYSSGYAVEATGASSLSLDHCILQNNDYGFYGNNSSPQFLSNNQIINNSDCGIYFNNCNSLGTIDNLTMTDNGNYGAFRLTNSTVTLGSNISYSGNAWPVSMYIDATLGAGSTVPSSGNTNNAIQLLGSISEGSATLSYPGVDYVITGYPSVGSAATLTINDGCTIRFNSARYLTINGTLNATGTSGNGILFTRNGSAEWGGLKFENGSNGTLEYCTVEYATY